MSIKYSFLMPYHMRVQQLTNTFRSFLYHDYQDRKDFEVVVMEDVKNLDSKVEHELLLKLADQYGKFFDIRVVTSGSERCFNPSALFNEAAEAAHGKFLILTNPECMHKTNILKGFDEELDKNPDAYIVAACIGADDCLLSVDQMLAADGYWYVHSEIRNIRCHYCAVISKDNYGKVGGFDQTFCKGVCFEDDDWRLSVLKVGIELVSRDDLIVVHQNHSKSKPRRYLELHNINKRYFLAKHGKDADMAENYILTEGMRYEN